MDKLMFFVFDIRFFESNTHKIKICQAYLKKARLPFFAKSTARNNGEKQKL